MLRKMIENQQVALEEAQARGNNEKEMEEMRKLVEQAQNRKPTIVRIPAPPKKKKCSIF